MQIQRGLARVAFLSLSQKKVTGYVGLETPDRRSHNDERIHIFGERSAWRSIALLEAYPHCQTTAMDTCTSEEAGEAHPTFSGHEVDEVTCCCTVGL